MCILHRTRGRTASYDWSLSSIDSESGQGRRHRLNPALTAGPSVVSRTWIEAVWAALSTAIVVVIVLTFILQNMHSMQISFRWRLAGGPSDAVSKPYGAFSAELSPVSAQPCRHLPGKRAVSPPTTPPTTVTGTFPPVAENSGGYPKAPAAETDLCVG